MGLSAGSAYLHLFYFKVTNGYPPVQYLPAVLEAVLLMEAVSRNMLVAFNSNPPAKKHKK